jgi:hypothetical protein
MTGFSFDPFWMFKAPWSGDVAQRITAPWFSPSLTVNYAGNAAIEDRVVTEVASYGRQLGWLSEIALALAKGEAPPGDALAKLQAAANAIERIKAETQVSAIETATKALDRLEREQPKEYEKLLRSRRAPQTAMTTFPNSAAER